MLGIIYTKKTIDKLIVLSITKKRDQHLAYVAFSCQFL